MLEASSTPSSWGNPGPVTVSSTIQLVLRLEPRPIRHGTYDETTARQAIFRILLSKTQIMESAHSTCEWREIEVETKEVASETREDLASEEPTVLFYPCISA